MKHFTGWVVGILSLSSLVSLAMSQASGLDKTLERYHRSKTVMAELVKVVKLSLLDRTQVSHGRLYLSNGKLRLELAGLEKTVLVIDGRHVWMERRLPEEFGGQVRVIQMAVGGHKKSLQGPLPILLGHKEALNDFKVIEKISGRQKVFQLKPKDGKEYPNLVKVEVTIEGEKLKDLSYWDELENKTSYRFGKTRFDGKISKSQFLYSPPKNAEVTKF